MKYGMKLFFIFCLSGMLSVSLLPINIYAQEDTQTETENVDEESSESKSELPKSSNTAPVYHFSLDKFLTEDEIEAAELKSENPNIRSRVTFADILLEATKYEGLPYVWGGRYPSQGGFDCAGLCMYVYNKICGTSFDLINTNAAMLYTSHCTPVSESEAQPGDLVFFKGTYEAIDYISHVGIYCGNGIMFNAGDPIGYGYVHDVQNMNGGKAEVLFGRVNDVDVVGCQSGFNNINGNWYYFDEDGNQAYGWQTINDKWYYFNKWGRMSIGWTFISGNWYYFDSEGSLDTGFTTIDQNTYYFDASGKMVTGWIQIDGTYYFFNASGIMKISSWQGGCYLNAEGKMLVNAFTPDGYYVGSDGVYITNHWFKVQGKDYYANGYGSIVKGAWVGSYYLGDDGVMLTNAFTPDGYYVGADGVYVRNQKVTVENKVYYLNAYGKVAKNQWSGDYYLDGNGNPYINRWAGSYWCGSDGKYVRNIFTPDGYYCGSNGEYVRNSWIKVDGIDYYMNAYGHMTKNAWVGAYYLGSDGKMQTNAFTPDGYYVGSDGVYITNRWLKVQGKDYYADLYGNIVKGAWVGSYYLGKDGVMLTNTFTPDGFYVGADGVYVRNQKITVEGKDYYLNTYGNIAKNQWFGDYYLDGNGNPYINRWAGSYWCGEDGKYVRSAWVDNNNSYVNENGVYLTNQWLGDYYLNGSGVKVTNTWVGNYWCGSDGKYVKSSWVDHDRYYVDSNGIYVAGALK